jgi:surfeit locus 1 family protein
MHFRPYPLLTFLAVPALALLIALGVWQSQRAGWKAGEVVAFEQRLAAPPLTPDQACAAGLVEGLIITPVSGEGEGLRVFGHRASGEPGWKIFQTTRLCDATLLVQTGFDALEIGGPGGKLPTPPPPAPDRLILQPWPEKPFMHAPNSPTKNEWHWFDAAALAQAAGQPALDARYLLVPLEGMPEFLVRTPPETHIGYAVTWFGMAIGFVVIYGLFHARAGRLRFGKAKQ